MIQYAITEPELEADPLRAYKYPFISGEVLSVASGSLLDLYFSAEEDEADSTEEDLMEFSAHNV